MRTVFFDVDTQIDFMFPAGALAVPGAAFIIENLAALTRFGASHAVQIISTADAHGEDDPEFKSWKPHCVVDTAGQQKIAATSLSKPMTLSSVEGALDSIADQAGAGGQIIIEKQKLDCFSNPNLRLLLDLLQADRFVVYGVASELCVRHAALGLLQTGAKVEVVKDAIKPIDDEKEREFLAQFQAHGGLLTTTAAATTS